MNIDKALNILELKKYEVTNIKDIKNAYRKKSLLVHPDKHNTCTKSFNELSQAYTFLSQNIDALKYQHQDNTVNDNNKLVFASEMKSIYPFLKSIQPNENINIYLQKLFDYESTENCVIKGIKRLPPGFYAIYKNSEIKINRWWNTLDHLEVASNNYNEQVEKWREIFLDSVKIRMRKS